MSGDNIVIVVNGGRVEQVYSDNANILATVVDLDEKKVGESYINTFEWPDTQFDDDEIKELMGKQYEDYYDEES
jgi:hypothetical protein